MPYYAGRMLASKIAYYARNSAGRFIQHCLLDVFPGLAPVGCFSLLSTGCTFFRAGFCTGYMFLLRVLMASLRYLITQDSIRFSSRVLAVIKKKRLKSDNTVKIK